jgi:hypothetical protein
MQDDEPHSESSEVLEVGGDDQRHPARTAVLALAVVAAGAVWWFGGSGGPDDAPSASPGSATTGPDEAALAAAEEFAEEHEGLAEAFHRFAEDGDASELSEWWAGFVTVSARGATWTMSGQEAAQRDSWRLPEDAKRAGRDALAPLVASEGDFASYSQEMDCGCHGNPRPAESTGRVSSRVVVAVRPPAGTPCESWWGVDLVLTPEDKVSQVLVRRASAFSDKDASSEQDSPEGPDALSRR